jgi:tRNA threonylcarbamoyl adenosine modification protein YeaZ
MMRALLIETSTERGLVAFMEDDLPLFIVELPFGYQNSRYLLPEIKRGLALTSLQIDDFSYIAVGIGPGSYTGIRIGAITAKTLAFASGIPLIGVPSLQTFVPKSDGVFGVVIDAKIGGVYGIKGKKTADKVEYLCPPAVVEIKQFGDFFQEAEFLVSPVINPLKQTVQVHFPYQKAVWEENSPDPLQFGTVAQQKFLRGEVSLDARLDLLYMRKSQAEIEKELKEGKKEGK